MKRTGHITLGVVMSALILSGCSGDRRCVDSNDVIVSDEQCKDVDGSRGNSSGHHWYSGGYGHGIGSRVSGGSYHSVSRGGFGSFAAAHFGGGA